MSRPAFLRSRARCFASRTPIVLAGLSVLAIASAAAVATSAGAAPGRAAVGDWPMSGQNILNTRSNPFETTITAANAGALAVKWTFQTHGDVSATPAVVRGAVYFPDRGGYLNKLDAATGRLIWSHPVSDYDGVAGAFSRTSPAVWGGTVYIGDQNGAHLIAVNAATGALVWARQLDSHPFAVLTQSPVVYGGVVYQGVSSQEEVAASDPSYPCCTFRGSMTAVDARTGAIRWKTYTVPDNGGLPGGYSGGAVWGSTAALEPFRHLVYITTGNNYSVPQSVTDCQNAGKSPQVCLSHSDHIDSILALDMDTGEIRWATGARQFDDYNTACLPGLPPNNCPTDQGPDYDFGDGAHVFVVRRPDGQLEEVVGAGEKSGQYWELDAGTGSVVWSAAPAPGGSLGGIQWGTATDFRRVYVAEANINQLPYPLPDGTTTTHGSFAALDPATGKVLWQVADPSQNVDWAPVTTAGGVVYAGSLSGHMYAIDAATGRILWDYQGPYSSNAGPAVVGGTVYWGNGYSFHGGLGTGSTTTGTFYAFSVGGR